MNKTLKCKEIMTVEEVAEFLSIGYETVLRYISSKKLTASKLGRIWRVRRTDLNKFLIERENINAL